MLVDVCICTFRRPHIEAALRSLAGMSIPTSAFRVIVADNDDVPSAKTLVETVASALDLNLIYVHAPCRNISVARNACLATATSPMIAFLDDDEEASPLWLQSLLEKADRDNVDIVLGPVEPVYESSCPKWIKEGNFHATKPVYVGHKITTGYCGNVLFKREAKALKGLFFREELGKTGGEDTAFFTQAFERGAVAAFAPDALATEKTDSDRTSLYWLMGRQFRSGQTHGLMISEKNSSFSWRFRNIVLASAKSLFCFLGSLTHIFSRTLMARWILRGTLHLGVVAVLLGGRTIEPYGHEV